MKDNILSDLRPGVVLHLDPDKLARDGAQITGAEQHRVRKERYFLCIEVLDSWYVFLPIYSGSAFWKGRIEKKDLRGFWPTRRDQYYTVEQIWYAKGEMVERAAVSDLSRVGRRKMVADTVLRKIAAELKQKLAAEAA